MGYIIPEKVSDGTVCITIVPSGGTGSWNLGGVASWSTAVRSMADNGTHDCNTVLLSSYWAQESVVSTSCKAPGLCYAGSAIFPIDETGSFYAGPAASGSSPDQSMSDTGTHDCNTGLLSSAWAQ